jgi:sterol desaturase/sphingolipid hydroxylase (fatty acid hydroxylase superfamily)
LFFSENIMIEAMDYEIPLRVGCFIAIFFIMSIFELLSPRRVLTSSKSLRWFNNLSLHALNSILVRGVFTLIPLSMAVLAAENGWGLLNYSILPQWQAVIISVIALDFIIYLQHVVFHAVPLFWRLHMVHHTDLDIDLTTGIRFHPVEIIFSMIIKLAAVAILGAPPLAVLIFEVVLNGASLFSHSNIHIPGGVDRILRLFLVTPDMHRVHHSVIIRETNTNFGFNLPWWDRLLGTYQEEPSEGHDKMTIGLGYFRDVKQLSLWWLLIMPLTRKKIGNLINPAKVEKKL